VFYAIESVQRSSLSQATRSSTGDDRRLFYFSLFSFQDLLLY
jgi:hypothetical protein